MAAVVLVDAQCLKGPAGQGPEVLAHVRAGGVAVIRDCLREIGYADELSKLTLAEMRLHCDAAQVGRIEKDGFEKVHEILSARQIFDVNVGLTERMKPLIGKLIGDFADQILGYGKRVYIYGLPVVRLFVPHDVFAANRDLFGKRQGFLQIQGPHHDTWFDHATESLNMWIAVGRVRRGNGLIVYPDHAQGHIEHDGSRCMPKAQSLGKSISFDLEPGDIIFFHGETLHSSELNVTDETRYVITNRFTLQKPRFKEHDQWQAWFDSKLLGTPLEKLAIWPTYLSRHYLVHKLKRNRLSLAFAKAWGQFSKGLAMVKIAESREPFAIDPLHEDPAYVGNSVTNPSPGIDDMAIGEIRAVTKDRCVLKLEDGIVSFSRFCPHEGADLAYAVCEDGRIQCPWHHLSFDARTGQQPCQSLKNLRMFPVNVNELAGREVEAESEDAASSGLTGTLE